MGADKSFQDDPERTAHAARTDDTQPPLHEAAMRNRRQRVLVMHGDAQIRRLIATSLTLEGFDVTTAASRQDCLHQARVAMPDILVATHKNMPGPGEWETATRFRRYLGLSRIKVLLINSAPDTREDQVVSTEIDACLPAPFNPAEMIRAVHNLATTIHPDPLSATRDNSSDATRREDPCGSQDRTV